MVNDNQISLEDLQKVVQTLKKCHVPLDDTLAVIAVPEKYYMDLIELDTIENGKEGKGQ